MHTSMNRYTAFAIHFSISALVLAVFFVLTFFVWYPAPYLGVEGTVDIIYILIGVDLILGPSLTLVVFKPGKPGLKTDLSLIAAVQIIALAYGSYTIYTERPYLVVFAIDRFEVITAATIADLSKMDKNIKLNRFGPSYVYAEKPADPAENQRIFNELLKGGPDIDGRPELYRPLAGYISRHYDRGRNLADVAKHPDNTAAVNAFIKKHNGNTDQFVFYPTEGKGDDVLLVIERESGQVVDYIAANPWKRLTTPKPANAPAGQVTQQPQPAPQ